MYHLELLKRVETQLELSTQRKELEEIRSPYDLAKSHSDGSTGFGLAYVNTVMVYHGGKMEITHDDGKI